MVAQGLNNIIRLTKSNIPFEDINRMLPGQRKHLSHLQISISLATILEENTTALIHRMIARTVKSNKSYIVQ